MPACGVLVVNPPWTLAARLADTLPWLTQVLGHQGRGRFVNRELIAEG